MSEVKLIWQRRMSDTLGDVYSADRTAGGSWWVILTPGVPPLFNVAHGMSRDLPWKDVTKFPTFLEADAYCAAENEKAEKAKEPTPVKEDLLEAGQWWGNPEKPDTWTYLESMGEDFLVYSDRLKLQQRYPLTEWYDWTNEVEAVNITALVRSGVKAGEWAKEYAKVIDDLKAELEAANKRADEFAKLCDGMAPLTTSMQGVVNNWLQGHPAPAHEIRYGRYPNGLLLDLIFKNGSREDELKKLGEKIKERDEKAKRLRERAIKAEVQLRKIRNETQAHLSALVNPAVDDTPEPEEE